MTLIRLRSKQSASERAAEADKIEYIAYRENHQVKYAAVRRTFQAGAHVDDDNDSTAPLVKPRLALEDDGSNDDLLRFTATGRPITEARAASNAMFSDSITFMAGGQGGMYMRPRLLPQKFTDDSIIPVIVSNLAPIEPIEAPRRKSFLGKLARRPSNEKPVKVVYMPRREYLKYFARDSHAQYIGTEPEKQWTIEELDETYGQYRPVMSRKKSIK